MRSDLVISFIQPEETYQLRHEILQPHLAFNTVRLNLDHDDNSFHLGAFHNKELITIGSFHLRSNPLFQQPLQYQLRKMATSDKHRNSGGGKMLLLFAIQYLRDKKVDLLWCNAREVALGFYEKLGFLIASDFFEEPGFGAHKVMYYSLQRV